MLRTNLSSRPFYNDRMVFLVIALVAALSLVLMAYNVEQLVALSSQRSALRAEIDKNTASIERADSETTALQHSVNQKTLQGLANSTQEANILINARTFSWTVFFNLVEKTLPDDVRLMSVAPQVDEGELRITMVVVAKRADDLDAFMQALDNTGAFYDAEPRTEETIDDGTRRVTLRAKYLPPAEVAKTVAPAAAAKPVEPALGGDMPPLKPGDAVGGRPAGSGSTGSTASTGRSARPGSTGQTGRRGGQS